MQIETTVLYEGYVLDCTPRLMHFGQFGSRVRITDSNGQECFAMGEFDALAYPWTEKEAVQIAKEFAIAWIAKNDSSVTPSSVRQGLKRQRVAVVSGGNRGVGLAVVEQLARAGFAVVLGSRSLSNGVSEAVRLQSEGLDVRAAQLDISNGDSVRALFGVLDRIDVLVNCAGVYLEGAANFLEIDEAILIDSLNINATGAWRMCKAAAPLMISQKFGRIVNVSTGWASLSEMEANAAAYRISKAALNAVTRVVANELANKGDIKVNSVCPGWVRTRMGGPDGQLSPADAARDVLWPAFFDATGPTGQFFRQRQPLPW